MKPEWITDNVKRATMAKCGIKDENRLGVGEYVPLPRNLQEALDLLHFAAERSGHKYTVVQSTLGFNQRMAKVELFHPETHHMPTFVDVGAPNPLGQGESLLHAVLLAVDAIVAHKPEAFA